LQVLVFYDVDVARIQEVDSFLGKYLHWRKTNVFEGELTEARLEEVKIGLKKVLNQDKDGALVLYKETGQYKESVVVVSKVRNEDNRILDSHRIDLGKTPAPLFVQPIGAWEKKEHLRKIVHFLTWKSFFKSIGL
jgi:CRISPR-associated protein Cas2